MHKNETKSTYLIHISTERLTMIMAHSTELRRARKKSGAKIKKLGAPVKSLVHKYQESGAAAKTPSSSRWVSREGGDEVPLEKGFVQECKN